MAVAALAGVGAVVDARGYLSLAGDGGVWRALPSHNRQGRARSGAASACMAVMVAVVSKKPSRSKALCSMSGAHVLYRDVRLHKVLVAHSGALVRAAVGVSGQPTLHI